MLLQVHNEFFLFDLFFTSHSTIFQLCQDGSSWVNLKQYLARMNVSCSKTQCSAAGEALHRNPSARVKHSTTEPIHSQRADWELYERRATIMHIVCFCLFCCFTSQVDSYGHGGTVSSPKHAFTWAYLNKQLTNTCAHTFACNWQQPFLNDSAEGRRMNVEIISWSISTKVWNRAGIKLSTPGSAVRLASVARLVTDCPRRPGINAY